MKKISVNMLSMANSVEGQGVASAYSELIKLLKNRGEAEFELYLNKGTGYDILHAHTTEPRNLFKLWFTKGATVAYVHFLPSTLDNSIRLPKFCLDVYKWYLIKFYKSASHLVVVNPSFKEAMIREGLDEEKITYIPNFVEKAKFYKKPEAEISQIRQKYGIGDDEFVVLGAGQTQTRKGVVDFAKVAELMPEVTFLWAGGFSFGKMTDGYETIKKIMDNPPKNLKFLGIIPRDDMSGLYNAADLFFLPSFDELFPMTILEAASCGTPIMLRNLELYENILWDKYLRADSVEGFIDCISKMKNDSEFYANQTKLATDISVFYSEEHVYDMWKEFYTSIVKAKMN